MSKNHGRVGVTYKGNGSCQLSRVDAEMKQFPVRFYRTCSSQELYIFEHQLPVHYDN